MFDMSLDLTRICKGKVACQKFEEFLSMARCVLSSQNKIEQWYFFVGLNGCKNHQQMKHDWFHVTDSGEAIWIINSYEEIIKTQSKKRMRYVAKRVLMLMKFTDRKDFIKKVGLSTSSIYFKIGLHNFLEKIPALKNVTLPSHYIKLTLEWLKRLWK